MLRAITSILLWHAAVVSSSGEEDDNDSDVVFQDGMYSCDALTPNLCDLQVTTGLVEMKGGISVKYWRYFEDKDHAQTKPPLVIAHGGPSWPHNYLLPLKQIACEEPREVIFYDQAGCGESKPPESTVSSVAEVYPWLLDPNYYALEEFPHLVESLDLGEFHLLGNSWGSILAQIFALDSKSSVREQMLSMTLSGCISDTQLYMKSQWDPNYGTLGRLPPFLQERIRTLVENKMFDTEEHQAIDDFATTQFTLRTSPFPDCFIESAVGLNPEINAAMVGPSEFTVSGAVLEDFNVTGRLHELTTLPVLVTSGAYDTVRPVVAEAIHKNLPISEQVLFNGSGHITEIDEAGLMNSVVTDFLARVEQARDLQEPFVPQNGPSAADDDFDTSLEQSGKKYNSATLHIVFACFLTAVSFLLGFMVGQRRPSRAGYQVIGNGI